jgi:hypothetical protein
MTAQTTKRCHWVPQSYLRAFAADTERQKIWRFGKEAGDPELKAISKVAVRHHLYAPIGADGRRTDALEKKLGGIEGFMGQPIWKAVCTDFPDLAWEPLRKMIALIVATSYVRTPIHFEKWKTHHRGWVEDLSKFPTLPTHVEIGGVTREVDPSDWEEFRSATEEAMKAKWNEFVGSSADLAQSLLRMRWAVLFTEQPAFITSDNPVHIAHPSMKFMGIKNVETVVSFPLSPTRMLVMDNRHNEQADAYYPLQGGPASENLLTTRNAIENIFSSRHPDIVCAEIVAYGDRHAATG